MSSAALSIRAEGSRKAIHLGTAVVPVAWGLGWVSVGLVQLALGVALAVAVLVETARSLRPAFATRFQDLLGVMLRPHEQRGVSGATWLAVAMWSVAMLAPPRAAIAALWAAAVGDATAALVGRTLAALRQDPPPAGKSNAGSLACALATALGAWWLAAAGWAAALALGLVAAAAERPAARLDDNLRVAAATALAAVLLGLR